MITLEKPASLPPMVIVTILVSEVTDEIWLFITSVVLAPLHATNVSAVFGRCCESRYG